MAKLLLALPFLFFIIFCSLGCFLAIKGSFLHTKISISGIEHQATIGILANERSANQPLITHLKLDFDELRAGRSGRLEDTFDYSLIADLVGFLWTCGRFGLLECAAEALAQTLIQVPIFGISPQRVEVLLTKPAALSNGLVSHSLCRVNPGSPLNTQAPTYQVGDFRIWALKIPAQQAIELPKKPIRGAFIPPMGMLNPGAYFETGIEFRNHLFHEMHMIYCEGSEALVQSNAALNKKEYNESTS